MLGVLNPPVMASIMEWCSDNYIGGMGAVVLANALKQNSGLRELHIKGNELGDSGSTAICDALKGKFTHACRCRVL